MWPFVYFYFNPNWVGFLGVRFALEEEKTTPSPSPCYGIDLKFGA